MWERQTAALSDYHCLNVDLPGHGKSNQVEWVSLADTAGKIAAIIGARATNGRAHIVGLSLGGYIALALLEKHANLADRVVISGVTTAPMPNRSLLPIQLGLFSILMQRRWFANMQARTLGLSERDQHSFTENLLAMSMPAYRKIYEEAAEFQFPSSLRQVTTPILVLGGSKETQIITQAVGEIARLMPNAQGRIVPNVGHGWNIETPALFSATVRAWISGSTLPDALLGVNNS